VKPVHKVSKARKAKADLPDPKVIEEMSEQLALKV
jgi:hypothetical protein